MPVISHPFAPEVVQPDPLSIQIKDVQYYARKAKPSLHILLQPWEAVAIVTNRRHDYFFVDVEVPQNALVVISRDHTRTHGRPYRIRVSRATVKRVRRIHTAADLEECEEFHCTLAGVQPSVFKVGSEIDFTETFDREPRKLHGAGLYISPTFSEAMKLMTFMVRYLVEDEKENI